MKPIEVPYTPTAAQIRSDLSNGIWLLLAAIALSAFYIGIAVYVYLDNYRFMQDAKPSSGVVQSNKQVVTRSRKGRRSVSYRVFVESEHGLVRLTQSDPLPVGGTVEFLYSPSMKIARTPSEGDSFWILGLFVLAFLGYLWWRSYEFFRSWYRFSHGHYTVIE